MKTILLQVAAMAAIVLTMGGCTRIVATADGQDAGDQGTTLPIVGTPPATTLYAEHEIPLVIDPPAGYQRDAPDTSRYYSGDHSAYIISVGTAIRRDFTNLDSADIKGLVAAAGDNTQDRNDEPHRVYDLILLYTGIWRNVTTDAKSFRHFVKHQFLPPASLLATLTTTITYVGGSESFEPAYTAFPANATVGSPVTFAPGDSLFSLTVVINGSNGTRVDGLFDLGRGICGQRGQCLLDGSATWDSNKSAFTNGTLACRAGYCTLREGNWSAQLLYDANLTNLLDEPQYLFGIYGVEGLSTDDGQTTKDVIGSFSTVHEALRR